MAERTVNETEAELNALDAGNEYAGGDAQDTQETFHDAMIRQAHAENQDKILKEVRKHITKNLIERKSLARQMELLDMQCSAIDAKLEELTSAVEAGQLITEDEVRAFMSDGKFMVAIDMETTGFDGSFSLVEAAKRCQPVKRRIHPRM